MTSAVATASQVQSRQLSAAASVEANLEQIQSQNPKLNAFTDITAERARLQAKRVDAAIAEGQSLPLAGVTFGVKNLFDIKDVVTRAGSKILRDNPPASGDAFLLTQLEQAGAILLGGLNMGEFAYDFTGENQHDGNALNPHNPGYMAGGSSGGSGTAVASGMVQASLGSDTNGSIRVPSSFCGLFGLKPTFGRLSRHGSYPFVASLDHLGPMARSAADLALLFDALQGVDANDPAQIPQALLNTFPLAEPAALKVASVTGSYFSDQASPQAWQALQTVAAALDTTDSIEIPEVQRARSAAYLITNAEGAALHTEHLRTRAADFDDETRYRFLAGNMLPYAWVHQAHRFRSWFKQQMAEIFQQVDVILAPATPFPALPSGTKMVEINGQMLNARANIGLFTQPFSFLGLPIVSVPVWLDDYPLPIGVQLIAAPWCEDKVLQLAGQLEQRGICLAPIAEFKS